MHVLEKVKGFVIYAAHPCFFPGTAVLAGIFVRHAQGNKSSSLLSRDIDKKINRMYETKPEPDLTANSSGRKLLVYTPYPANSSHLVFNQANARGIIHVMHPSHVGPSIMVVIS